MHALLADAAAALTQLMTSWIRRGMPYPPEKMAESSAALVRRIFLREGGSSKKR